MSKAWSVPGLDPLASVEQNARKILRVRIAEYFSWAPIVDDENAVEELHALRISAKRLRYTIELFAEQFGAAGERNLSRVKTIQEALGNLHDTDIRIELIKEELTMLAAEQTELLGKSLASAPLPEVQAIASAAMRPPPDDPRRGLVVILAREYALRHQQYENFANLWRQYASDEMRAELLSLTRSPAVLDLDIDEAERRQSSRKKGIAR